MWIDFMKHTEYDALEIPIVILLAINSFIALLNLLLP